MPDYTLDVRSIASAVAAPGRSDAAVLQRFVAQLPTIRAGGAVHLTQGPRPVRLGAVPAPSAPPSPHAGALDGPLAKGVAGQDMLASGPGTRSTTLRHGALPFAASHTSGAPPADGGGEPARPAGGGTGDVAGGAFPQGVADRLDGVAPHGGLGQNAREAAVDDAIFGGSGGLTAHVQRAVAAMALGAPDPQHAAAIDFGHADALTVHALTIDFGGGPADLF